MAMIEVGNYGTIKKADAAGEMLLRYGIRPQLEGATVFVPETQAEEARTLLGIAEEEEEKRRTEPFHPCPKCSTPDPIWFGKRKIVLLVAILIGSLIVGQFVSASVFWAALGIAFVVLFVGFFQIPEYECRRCGNRWTREPRREA
jgi:hypothetical protein